MSAAGGHREPYVGSGADGARRSAQIDREQRDLLDRFDFERWASLTASMEAWERQARELDESAAIEASNARQDARYRRMGGRS